MLRQEVVFYVYYRNPPDSSLRLRSGLTAGSCCWTGRGSGVNPVEHVECPVKMMSAQTLSHGGSGPLTPHRLAAAAVLLHFGLTGAARADAVRGVLTIRPSKLFSGMALSTSDSSALTTALRSTVPQIGGVRYMTQRQRDSMIDVAFEVIHPASTTAEYRSYIPLSSA